MPWVIISLADQHFAVSAGCVREIFVVTTAAAALPQAPPFIRGVLSHRGRVLTVVDLRTRLGLQSVKTDTEKFLEMLAAREQDHVRWLTELDASVREKRPFTLSLDPNGCAFGKWLNGYRTDNLSRREALNELREPHIRIHGVGDAVEELKRQDKFDEAAVMVKDSQTVLTAVRSKFAHLRSVILESEGEIALVIETPTRSAFIALADAVHSVEKFAESCSELSLSPSCRAISANNLVRTFGKTAEGKLFLILDVLRVLPAADTSKTA
jgi:chemotaxis signal transduction protein